MKPSEMLERLKKGEDPLELSIQKWQDIVDGKGGDWGRSNCALCQVFYAEDDTCEGCPVERETGFDMCIDSPYSRVVGNSLAKEELEFLKSLRKKEAQNVPV